MGVILGTVPGWEKAPEWTADNRIYIGPAYIKYEIPPIEIPVEKRYEYRVTLDITIYLCDTPDLITPIVIRKIIGIKMIGIFEKAYPGGLDQWISDVSIREAEELLSRSNIEVAGLIPCEKGYDIESYDSEEKIPVIPVPEWVFGVIEYMERLYREAETIDEKIAIREEIERFKRRYGLEGEGGSLEGGSLYEEEIVPVILGHDKWLLNLLNYMEKLGTEDEYKNLTEIKEEIERLRRRYGIT